MNLEGFKTRQAKYGSYTTVYIVVVVAILASINYLADRHNKTFDATANKIYSLSEQTVKILDGLEADVKISYFDRSTDFQAARGSLVRYSNASNRVEVEYIDPDSRPDLAQAMKVRSYGTLFVEYGGNQEEAQSIDEEDITNAIIRAKKGQAKTACFLTGHGEAASDGRDRDGLAGASEEIETANYSVTAVSLLERPEIPTQCTVLIVAGPQTRIEAPELDILKEYVVGGGRLLLMIGQSKSPEIADLVAEWGIRIKDDTIVDLTGIGQLFGGGPLTPLVANYEDHPITEVMGSAATFFPYARTVEPGDPVANWKVDQLFSTTSGSFATEKLEIVDQELVRNSARETEGPISVAVAATHDIPEKTEDSESSSENEEVIGSEESEKQGRVVVIGSSRFARNYSLGRGSNLDLLLNALNWLSSDEDLISIRPSDPENTPLDLTQSDMTKLFFLTVIGLPTLIVILGLWVWWRRR
ncbi:MAG: hypothetical protein CMN58_02550 [Solibacterales bacterium]|nr:hypothetical protein [Bryobacterales bacterium]|tara:strand:+ start:14315 stop:15730 length:1416 start_codon:yes stop_codon:yes gene_type:complete